MIHKNALYTHTLTHTHILVSLAQLKHPQTLILVRFVFTFKINPSFNQCFMSVYIKVLLDKILTIFKNLKIT